MALVLRYVMGCVDNLGRRHPELLVFGQVLLITVVMHLVEGEVGFIRLGRDCPEADRADGLEDAVE